MDCSTANLQKTADSSNCHGAMSHTCVNPQLSLLKRFWKFTGSTTLNGDTLMSLFSHTFTTSWRHTRPHLQDEELLEYLAGILSVTLLHRLRQLVHYIREMQVCADEMCVVSMSLCKEMKSYTESEIAGFTSTGKDIWSPNWWPPYSTSLEQAKREIKTQTSN